MTPLYLENRTLFGERITELNKLLEECRVCPSGCGTKRTEGEIGNCGASDEMSISSYGAHFGEEPELIGRFGYVVLDAVKEMHRQTGNLKLNRRGVAERGVLIRHLVLPGNIPNSKGVVDFIANEISRDSYVNIMEQYHPAYRAGEFPELSKPVPRGEFECIVSYAREKGLRFGF